MSGVLKRKFVLVEEEDHSYSSSSPLSSFSSLDWQSDGESFSSDDQDVTPSIPALPTTSLPIRSILKKPRCAGGRSSVSFDVVTVFLFPRCQGFTSVPSRGGATLGMVRRHSDLRKFTLAEHAVDRQHRRRERLRERLRHERLEALRHKLLTTNGGIDLAAANRLTIDQIPNEDLDIHLSDAELADGSFLYPYPSRQRQALLRAAGVKRVDREEKRQLHSLRLSREDCGCDCQGFCEPETCACSLAGIKCQMDRSSFPCGCTEDGCGNTNGRVEFNSRRVQTHYLHTVMRLELERRLQDETVHHLDQRRVPLTHLENQRNEGQDQYDQPQHAQEKSCPFGFTVEEDGLPLTIPTTPTYHFSAELAVVRESSCSSDMSCSSANSEDSDAGGSPLVNQPLLEEGNEGLVHMLNLGDSETEECSIGSDSGARHIKQQSYQCHSDSGVYAVTNTATSHADNSVGLSIAKYLDENANQATALFAISPFQEYPKTPSPSIDYPLSSYMDLSLSSESDLEFFDNFPDYSSGPLHKSFKRHTYPDNYLQLLSPPNRPRYDETSTCLLESLIGLSEPTPEPHSSFTDNQLLEVIQ